MKLPDMTLEEEIEILRDTIDSDAPQKMREAARDRLIVIHKLRQPSETGDLDRPVASPPAPAPQAPPGSVETQTEGGR